jgi:hypothetical protein
MASSAVLAQSAPPASAPVAGSPDRQASDGGRAPPDKEPGAPAFIKGSDSITSVDPDQTSAIIETDGRNPTAGKSQQMKCPGGQVLTQAQGNLRGTDCR